MTIRGATTFSAELHRVADEVLPHHRQQGRIADRPGAAAARPHDLGAGFLDRRREVVQGGVQGGVEVDLGRRGVEPPDPGERQQVVDQHLHALGAVDREADVLGSALVEFVAVALLEQLTERGDLAQWFLQIVGCDVGELLEFGVRPSQFDGLLVERRWADRDASSSSTMRCRIFSTSVAMPRMSLGPCRIMRSPKLPS